ncbi:UDP-glycosyltransferase 71K1-like [Durio zibethinus]|uniref:Glycosyltransferase n=1 Tax=Durio zibethinus TaxID=66656 RepID=A0A6P6A5S9_DURZI|nr:UDP-glycosyltransferase 71K1-like [Durio zibethinus]
MEIVFMPTPAIGHLVSHVEFAKRLLDQDDRFSVTVLVINPVFAPEIRTYAESLAASDGRLRFIDLSQIQFALPSLPQTPKLLDKLRYIESHKLHVKQSLINQVLLDSVSFAGLVVDTFTTPMIDVANELGLPSYLLNTSSAASLAFMLHLVSRHDQAAVAQDFQAPDTESVIPGYMNPVPIKVLNSLLFDKNWYNYFLNLVRRFKETKAMITNSFAELECHAVKSLLELENNIRFYMVGPLLDLHGRSSSLCDKAQRNEVMKWLDNQPPSTVVFLCFGSLVPMDEAQAREIAQGLERCGHRFLWSVRIQMPMNDESEKPNNGTNLKEILPQGFSERTKGRGLVCSWAPQIEVLAHKSIGGFVSHCGWNSILESLWYGVPILTWPMYAEQQRNAFQMVKDLGLAVEMRLDYKLGESDLVMADEIEKAIKCLMGADSSASEVRIKVKKMSQVSKEAVMDSNGSSFTSFARLIEFMIDNAYNKP